MGISTQKTLLHCLCRNASESPTAKAFVFVRGDLEETASVTWQELLDRVRNVAATLRKRNCSGKTALIACPSSIEYIVAFLGCMASGTVAVPIYPPRQGRTLERIASILADAKPDVVFTLEEQRRQVKEALAEMGGEGLELLSVEEAESAKSEGDEVVHADRDSVAYLQYTSGSIASPKGVMVTHGNLLENARMFNERLGSAAGSIVSWMPLFHDFGLIGIVLQAIYSGGRCVLMAPETFLMRPVRWLQAASRYRAGMLGGPNFAWELCVSRIKPDQIAKLDLSCVEAAINGAEPVRARTLEDFLHAFKPAGFRRDALRPGYGLAEATLTVTCCEGAPRMLRARAADLEQRKVIHASDDEAGQTRMLVSCGKPVVDCEVRIVDEESLKTLPEGVIGEVVVSGPHIAKGYHGRTEESNHTFACRITDNEGMWLRTGDLGCLVDGELYVTGRSKDLMIMGGRNHYPPDIELTAERAHPALRRSSCAAFSIEEDREEVLVIVAELERTALRSAKPSEILAAVRRGIAMEHDVHLHDMVLIRPGSLSRTSSGKIRRQNCRAMYLDNVFTVFGESANG